MVVWWTKHQLVQKTTRHTPKHTPQGASRLVCGESACDLARAHLASMHAPARQHAYAHSPRLARLKGVMVVWWTKHQLGQKTTCHTPKHTPQGASRLVCGECACDLARAHLVSMHTPTRHVWHV